jgi:AcrR family transcriptional regulator
MAGRSLPAPPKQDRAVATRQRLLDAAVDELMEFGYAPLTTSAVAHRAGVSRGAQQRYFPRKEVLVSEAVRHLAQRQVHDLREQIAGTPKGRARAQRALDVVFEQYSGRRFAVMIELALASRGDPDLQRIVAEQERTTSRAAQESAHEIFGAEVAGTASFAQRWAMTLGTVRGVALLLMLGHPRESVERQWSFARRELLRILFEG